MEKIRYIVGMRLKAARGKLSQTFVAKSLGISQAVLSKIESGIREPTAAEIKKFAELYKKPVAYFFESTENLTADALKLFFEDNAHDLNIEMAVLYGSFARGIPNDQSDLDIAVMFDSKKMTDKKKFDIISNISIKLNGKFKREANIIEIRNENWKPMLYYNIIVLGELLFTKSKNQYLSMRWEASRQMEDFVVMGVSWQIAAARVNLGRF